MPPNDRPTSKRSSRDDQVPELVLQHDRHFLGILRAACAADSSHALGAGVERDVEMMLARQAVLGGVLEHRVHDAAQRLLGQDVVADVIDGHGTGRLLPARLLRCPLRSAMSLEIPVCQR